MAAFLMMGVSGACVTVSARCRTVLLHNDKKISSFRNNNALDIIYDLKDRKA
jgi:hypothetical protein